MPAIPGSSASSVPQPIVPQSNDFLARTAATFQFAEFSSLHFEMLDRRWNPQGSFSP
jgi:hypothetical protein